MQPQLKTPDVTPVAGVAFLQPLLTLVVAFGFLDAGQADTAEQLVIGGVSLGIAVAAFIHDVMLRRNRAKYLAAQVVEGQQTTLAS